MYYYHTDMYFMQKSLECPDRVCRRREQQVMAVSRQPIQFVHYPRNQPTEDERRKVDVTSINCIAATAQLKYSSIVKSEVSDNPIKLQEEDMILYKHRADSRY